MAHLLQQTRLLGAKDHRTEAHMTGNVLAQETLSHMCDSPRVCKMALALRRLDLYEWPGLLEEIGC